MTLKTTLKTASAIGAILAATTFTAAAQSSDDVTAEDLGVDTEVQAEQAETMPMDDAQSATGDTTMMAEGDYTDEKLSAFVTAALDVRGVRENYAQQIAEATDRAAAEALVAEAQAEMVTAIEDAGDITLEEYSEIGNAVQTDLELAERLTAMFEAEMGGAMEEDSEDQS